MIQFPITYTNGNSTVTIHEDGTKIRDYDGSTLLCDYPESCDLKITNYCDLGDKYDDYGNLISKSKTCPYCHEMSHNKGQHADLHKIVKLWKDAPKGTELAIGGGNPLAHPDLEWFLTEMKSIGVLCNITVNILHLNSSSQYIKYLQDHQLIHGLGISYRGKNLVLPDNIDYKNAVFHLILGVHTFNDCMAVMQWSRNKGVPTKILLLGYKQYGNGSKYYSDFIGKQLDKWKKDIVKLMLYDKIVLSFDNLALDQLEMQNKLSSNAWDKFYMGRDGVATFYCDAIEERFSLSSTCSIKHPLESLKDMFTTVKGMKNA